MIRDRAVAPTTAVVLLNLKTCAPFFIFMLFYCSFTFFTFIRTVESLLITPCIAVIFYFGVLKYFKFFIHQRRQKLPHRLLLFYICLAKLLEREVSEVRRSMHLTETLEPELASIPTECQEMGDLRLTSWWKRGKKKTARLTIKDRKKELRLP